jgi:Ornithine decarboxylase antizyme
VLDAQNHNTTINGGGYLLDGNDEERANGLSSSTSSGMTLIPAAGLVDSYLEVWDYQGGCRFRGFVAERDEETAMFVFFDEGAFGHGLKPA